MVQENGFLPRTPQPIKNELMKDVKRAAESAEKHAWYHTKQPSLRTLQQIKESGKYDLEPFRTIPMSRSCVVEMRM